MILDRVTITGADDTTDPRRLLRLSNEFPFVEWGLLFGAGVGPGARWQEGAPRFPSHAWVELLIETARHREEPLNLSLHLCGKYMRGAIEKGDGIVRELISPHIWDAADRIQLNFHAIAREVDPVVLAGHVERSQKDWIFQLDGVNDHVFTEIFKHTVYASPLFDRSGGAGRLPSAWPNPVLGAYCGYAGGLGPSNLLQQLRLIEEAAGDHRIWIDMETRVRNDDDTALDLERVREALEICKPMVGTLA